ncbi:MAG: NADH-quinone oxidoreductase subunit M [Actinomycetota bacterium]|nr:NADH-quinone oxidoreductase subunit M [Actinomycetota bacterium]
MNEIAAVDQIGFPVLSTLLALPVVALVVLAFLRSERLVRALALGAALVELALSLLLVARFRTDGADFQFAEQLPWIDAIGLSYHLAVDGVSLLFVPLTALLVVLVILTSWSSVRHQPKVYLMTVLGFETVAMGVFTAVDLILFFIFWELLLVPTFILVKVWGIGPDRTRAAVKYVLYMLTGSAGLLLGFILLGVNYRDAPGSDGELSFDLLALMGVAVPAGTQTTVFFLLAFAFALKAPMFPFHSWMPAALLEGPIGMAVFLTGLKMGVFGFLRFVMPLVPDAFVTWSWLLAVLGVVAILFGALVALAEPNVRRLIAFASVSHVGLALFGLASLNVQGVQGALFLILSLGLTSTGLLLAAGFVQQRVGSTDIAALGGLAQRAPALALLALVACLSALALPGTVGFPGEFLVLLGAFRAYSWLAAIAVVSVILTAAYMLVVYERAFNGPVTSPVVAAAEDLRRPEAVAAVVTGLAIVAFGFFPGAVLETSEESIRAVVERLSQSAAQGIRGN